LEEKGGRGKREKGGREKREVRLKETEKKGKKKKKVREREKKKRGGRNKKKKEKGEKRVRAVFLTKGGTWCNLVRGGAKSLFMGGNGILRGERLWKNDLKNCKEKGETYISFEGE